MSQAINLKDTGSAFRDLVQALRSSNEACEVKDDTGQTVAVVLPAERYASYQEYQCHREAERLAVLVDWVQAARLSPPPQHWFED